jgi:phospholipid/cholesterol/gamma-HCH transport system ATP-binding protein
MIKAENIFKSFGDNEVLKDISVKFRAGKTNLIIGRSGAGKTVLLKILVGLMQPTTGEVFYDDINLNKLNREKLRTVRQQMGMLFQGSALFDSMTIEENIRFPLDMFSNWTVKEKRDRVDFCLERVNLEKIHDRFPSEISGGMQKRVGIARSIVFKPNYLFCDEPNSGLDPKSAILIDQLISSITKEYNITTIINTHDMNSVLEIGEKIILLYDGKIAWKGNKDEVLTSENDAIRSFVFASPFLQRIRDIHFDA